MSYQFTISDIGLRLIKAYEGFWPEARELASGGHVVGFGHRLKEGDDEALSESEAEEVLKADLEPIENFINSRVHASMTQSQFDALCSLIFSIGEDAFLKSDMLHALNRGQVIEASSGFDMWRRGNIGGRIYVVDALVRRRTAEKALFLRPTQRIARAPRFELASIRENEPIVQAEKEEEPLVEDVPVAAFVAPEKKIEEITKPLAQAESEITAPIAVKIPDEVEDVASVEDVAPSLEIVEVEEPLQEPEPTPDVVTELHTSFTGEPEVKSEAVVDVDVKDDIEVTLETKDDTEVQVDIKDEADKGEDTPKDATVTTLAVPADPVIYSGDVGDEEPLMVEKMTPLTVIENVDVPEGDAQVDITDTAKDVTTPPVLTVVENDPIEPEPVKTEVKEEKPSPIAAAAAEVSDRLDALIETDEEKPAKTPEVPVALAPTALAANNKNTGDVVIDQLQQDDALREQIARESQYNTNRYDDYVEVEDEKGNRGVMAFGSMILIGLVSAIAGLVINLQGSARLLGENGPFIAVAAMLIGGLLVVVGLLYMMKALFTRD